MLVCSPDRFMKLASMVTLLTTDTITSKANSINLSGLQAANHHARYLTELDLCWVCRSGGKQAMNALQVEVQTRVQTSTIS